MNLRNGHICVLLGAIAVVGLVAVTAVASPPICCFDDGSCEYRVGCYDCIYGEDRICVVFGDCAAYTTLCRIRSTGECVFMNASCTDAWNCRADVTCIGETQPTPKAEEPENVCWADEAENICLADDYDEDVED